jgi:hypothetical protein
MLSMLLRPYIWTCYVLYNFPFPSFAMTLKRDLYSEITIGLGKSSVGVQSEITSSNVVIPSPIRPNFDYIFLPILYHHFTPAIL